MQEIWRSNHTTYADDVAAPNGIPVPVMANGAYVFTLGAPNPPNATTYVLIATPQGDQANDKDEGTPCTPLQINQSNTKTPGVCW